MSREMWQFLINKAIENDADIAYRYLMSIKPAPVERPQEI